jgi:hypothetical protein
MRFSFLLLAIITDTVNSFSASNTAIDFNNAVVTNVNKGTERPEATAVANAVTMNSQTGVITSSTADLGGFEAETITVTNSLCATTSIVLAFVHRPCTEDTHAGAMWTTRKLIICRCDTGSWELHCHDS